MSRAKGYPIIGGPLAGQFAREQDFYPERRAARASGPYKPGDVVSPGGVFGPHSKQYVAYNRADAHRNVPTRIWLHVSLIGI